MLVPGGKHKNCKNDCTKIGSFHAKAISVMPNAVQGICRKCKKVFIVDM